jgi:hypothetical protein
MIDTTYRCEICGETSEDPMSWVVIRCEASQLTIYRWSQEAVDAPQALHYCGQRHAQMYISRWFEADNECP